MKELETGKLRAQKEAIKPLSRVVEPRTQLVNTCSWSTYSVQKVLRDDNLLVLGPLLEIDTEEDRKSSGPLSQKFRICKLLFCSLAVWP